MALTRKELEELLRAQEAGGIPNITPDSSIPFEADWSKNPYGDFDYERQKRLRGTVGGGFDWRNIVPNTLSDIRGGLQGLFEREEDNLFEYNPKAELQEELKRTGLEEHYLSDPTRYSGPEPPDDRGWTSRFSPFSEARASTNVMQPMSSKAGLGAAGLIDMSSFDLERQLSFKKKSYEDIAIDFIKDKESYGKAPDHDKVFDDFGTDRIGYGRSPDPGETTTTRAKEDTWLQSYVKDLGDFIDDVVTINLLPNQKAALISLVFNVGKDAFKISYALKALNLGDMEEFKKQAFSKNHGFVKSNGKYVPGLYNRRQSEQDLFFN